MKKEKKLVMLLDTSGNNAIIAERLPDTDKDNRKQQDSTKRKRDSKKDEQIGGI